MFKYMLIGWVAAFLAVMGGSPWLALATFLAATLAYASFIATFRYALAAARLRGGPVRPFTDSDMAAVPSMLPLAQVVLSIVAAALAGLSIFRFAVGG